MATETLHAATLNQNSEENSILDTVSLLLLPVDTTTALFGQRYTLWLDNLWFYSKTLLP